MSMKIKMKNKMATKLYVYENKNEKKMANKLCVCENKNVKIF